MTKRELSANEYICFNMLMDEIGITNEHIYKTILDDFKSSNMTLKEFELDLKRTRLDKNIDINELINYKKDFKLEAQLLEGTLTGCKDNKISCIARIKEASNCYGEKSKGIIDVNGSALWIDLNNLSNWNIKATEL